MDFAPPFARRSGVGGVDFVIRRGAEALAQAILGRAEIADPAALPAVGQVAEVADHGGHAALIALRIAKHQVQLLLLLVGLRDVGVAPVVVAAGDGLGEIDERAAVNT